MKNWLDEIKQHYDTPLFVPKLEEFIDYFDSEYKVAKEEVKINEYISTEARTMPGITEQRYYQYQMIEGVLEFLDIKYRQLRSKEYRRFLENYNRTVTSRDAEKYIDSEDAIIEMAIHMNDVKNLRSKFVSITKGLETKHFQLTNLTKLKAAGLDI